MSSTGDRRRTARPLLRADLTHPGPGGAHSESEIAIRPKAQKITKSEYP